MLRRKRKRSKKKKWLHARECTIGRRVHIMQKHREMEAIVVFVEGDEATLRVSNGEVTTVAAGSAEQGVEAVAGRREAQAPPARRGYEFGLLRADQRQGQQEVEEQGVLCDA